MKVDMLLTRMGKVRLFDMINGYPIMSKINQELGEELITIEMSGTEVSNLIKAMPTSTRERLFDIEAIELDDEDDTIAMIDKVRLHQVEIASRSAQVVESNLRSIVYVTMVFLVISVILFRVFIGDLAGLSGLKVEGLLYQIVKMIYEQP